MNLWRTTKREVVAALRSLRYDLLPARHSARTAASRSGPTSAAHRARTTAPLPAVENDIDDTGAAYQAYARRGTGRIRTAAVVAALAVAGSVITYFGVVGGLSALLASESQAPSALPGASADRNPTAAAPRRPPSRGSLPTGLPPAAAPPAAAPPPAGPVPADQPAADVPRKPGPTTPRSLPDPKPESTGPIPSPAPTPTTTPTCGCPTGSPDPSGSPSPSPPPGPTESPRPCDRTEAHPARSPEPCTGPADGAQP